MWGYHHWPLGDVDWCNPMDNDGVKTRKRIDGLRKKGRGLKFGLIGYGLGLGRYGRVGIW